MKNRIFLITLIVYMLTACNGSNSQPTITATPTPPSEPSLAPFIQSRNNLPTGWKLDENLESSDDEFFTPFYEKYGLNPNPEHRTVFFWTARPEHIAFNGQEIGVREIEELNSTIEVTIDKAVITSIECGPEVSAFGINLITYWVYENHWIVELICHGQADIMLDGKFLNSTNGYSRSFSPYLISGNLFFFFERGDEVGFVYNNMEYLLNYDEISYVHCCGLSELNPAFYQDQVMFMGLQDGIRHYVIIGNLDLP